MGGAGCFLWDLLQDRRLMICSTTCCAPRTGPCSTILLHHPATLLHCPDTFQRAATPWLPYRWIAEYGGQYIDDVTACLVVFED